MVDTVAEAISDLTFAFELLQAQLVDLTEAELTEEIVEPEDGSTVRDIVAHLTGWEEYVLEVLPIMLSTIDNQIPPLDVSERNKKALEKRQGKSVGAILAEFEEKHGQILDILDSASPEALTLRRTQRGRIFTIKSYVIDVLQDHILRHVDELKLWRAGLERSRRESQNLKSET